MSRTRIVCFLIYLACFFTLSGGTAAALEQGMSLKAGVYLPETHRFEVGSGLDLGYSIRPFRYSLLTAALGYFRAEQQSAFMSALPLTLTFQGVLPLEILNLNAGAGIGGYYKMAGGTTELPADKSEFSFGYHIQAGLEVPTTSGVALLLEAKYLFVNQDDFKAYAISHDGLIISGGFGFTF